MTSDVIEALERLAPVDSFIPDWEGVLQRVGEPPRRTPSRVARVQLRKRRLLGVALAAAVLSSLAALAAADEWWSGESRVPAPSIPPPLVVKTGSWDGHEWALVAYRTSDGELCFSMNPSSSGFSATPSCGSFVGEPGRADEGQPRIAYLSGASPELPAFVVGPVVGTAEEVVIQLAGGELRTPTFDVPASLGAIRFYLARVPDTLDSTGSIIERLIGLDADGRTVACLAVRTESPCD